MRVVILHRHRVFTGLLPTGNMYTCCEAVTNIFDKTWTERGNSVTSGNKKYKLAKDSGLRDIENILFRNLQIYKVKSKTR